MTANEYFIPTPRRSSPGLVVTSRLHTGQCQRHEVRLKDSDWIVLAIARNVELVPVLPKQLTARGSLHFLAPQRRSVVALGNGARRTSEQRPDPPLLRPLRIDIFILLIII